MSGGYLIELTLDSGAVAQSGTFDLAEDAIIAMLEHDDVWPAGSRVVPADPTAYAFARARLGACT